MFRVKSSKTSGPLMVSSQLIHVPHGVMPPAQFIWVPARAGQVRSRLPSRSTRT